ncbi:hypothetical protein K2173_028255 [Erythroxylum novogranatense]|uniref:Exonuclease 1 n=1 Tax=Erythroxylum novogranatense TaxID=1862640 RepID=A0AAV8U414_9ROSI|nr:hypothetical protein K2173_028255 [Erythroxylum novogranatense]
MGIKDLLKFMKPYIEPIHIKKYAGKRVGIDAYSWLHKGAYSCSMEICLDANSEKKLRYLDYFMHRINLLKHYNITPVVVFDGGSIPCKAATQYERYRKRQTNRELAMEKLKEGDVNAASELFQRAVNITPFMAYQLIQILRSESIEFVVAPYEADAQLAYLSGLETEKDGIAAVITEDSDLLAYGCQATIFKMDRYGNGEEIILDKVFDTVDRRPSFQNFSKELFTGMCVLAGCDFLPSIPGIGIVKAHSFVSKYRNNERVLSVLKLEKGSQMPEDYCNSFREAFAVFQYARIYDTNTKSLKHMKPLSQTLLGSSDKDLDFLGPEIPSSIASAIAEGNLNPANMEAFDRFSSSGLDLKPLIKDHCTPKKVVAIVQAKHPSSCFVGPFSNETRGVVMKQNPVLGESKYIHEALALQKLVSSPEVREEAKEAIVWSDIPVRISKNPFKIEAKGMAEEISISVEDENSIMSLEFPDNGISKKRKHQEINLDQGVTEVEKFQESVDKRTSSGKGRGKLNKPKMSNQNTIFKFFSRVQV